MIFKNKILLKTVSILSKETLVIYLYHMHPIFKRLYSSWDIFRYFYSDVGIIYFGKILCISVCIFFVGFIISTIISRIASFFSLKIVLFAENIDPIKGFLSDCMISLKH